jgi:hypothetical protein
MVATRIPWEKSAARTIPRAHVSPVTARAAGADDTHGVLRFEKRVRENRRGR